MDSLTNRVCRLVSGGFNTLISIAENSAPEMVMEEAIREIDSAMDEVRAELGSVIAKKHLAKTRLNAETNKHADLATKIGLAVREKRDDLAETAISRQLDVEALFPVLNANINDCKAREKELEDFLRALNAKKREMMEELQHYQESKKLRTSSGMETTGESVSSRDMFAKVANAESTFERIMRKAGGAPLASVSATDRAAASHLVELDEMQRQSAIRERLNMAKIKFDNPS